MLKTFLSELMTQSKTALSLGTRLMVFKGRSTRRTRRDFIVARFSPPELPLEEEDKNIQKVIMISRGAFSSFKNNKNKGFFYKHTIKVCISCFRLYPGTSALEQYT